MAGEYRVRRSVVVAYTLVGALGTGALFLITRLLISGWAKTVDASITVPAVLVPVVVWGYVGFGTMREYRLVLGEDGVRWYRPGSLVILTWADFETAERRWFAAETLRFSKGEIVSANADRVRGRASGKVVRRLRDRRLPVSYFFEDWRTSPIAAAVTR
ncbi:hypothetical protein CLV40_102270 [Actinokineospora auranticolor]|uniref:Uncharacterized protein n=2 Tax=Actinokineospora auranticolor TaxID=155976 RepID=A0A2S6GYW0_9PSEU|nr:hypothetical protein CLV40_102270 [Actinokineospora auranticolor]